LRKFENHGRKERVSVDDYTIEHILPQNDRLSQEWKVALGEEWAAVQEKWLHTLGNLTLTGYNSEYSDKPFPLKRDMEGGFKESPLRVNQGLGQLEAWTETEIKLRADRMARHAAKVWSSPDLLEDILESYQSSVAVSTDYTIDDHPHLIHGKMHELFEGFRREVMALDVCVTEQFLKLYVAYKAETNFVDVVPQAKALRLSLNIDPHELSDPRDMVVDVTGVGRWGNGNSEVKLSDVADLQYVVGLVRQSLERQLGAEEVEA
jgi:predicted transport protein